MDYFFGIPLYSWQFWTIAAVLLFIIEIFTPGFVIATFAVGGLCAAIAALVTDNFDIQLLVFALSTTLTYFYIRPFAKRYFFRKTPDLPTNADALIGKKAKVIETIDPMNSKGRVKLFGGEDWKAVSADESVIEIDAVVEVASVDSAKLIVRKP